MKLSLVSWDFKQVISSEAADISKETLALLTVGEKLFYRSNNVDAVAHRLASIKQAHSSEKRC